MGGVSPLLIGSIVVLAHFQALVQVLVWVVHVGLVKPSPCHE